MKNKLADPRKSYLAEGGEIFIAVDNTTGKSAGVCALLHQAEQDRWELAKLSVDPAYRGLGIGGKLADAVIELARQIGALRLYLESNRILEAAIRNCARNPQANEPVSAGRRATMPFAGRTPGRIELR